MADIQATMRTRERRKAAVVHKPQPITKKRNTLFQIIVFLYYNNLYTRVDAA